MIHSRGDQVKPTGTLCYKTHNRIITVPDVILSSRSLLILLNHWFLFATIVQFVFNIEMDIWVKNFNELALEHILYVPLSWNCSRLIVYYVLNYYICIINLVRWIFIDFIWLLSLGEHWQFIVSLSLTSQLSHFWPIFTVYFCVCCWNTVPVNWEGWTLNNILAHHILDVPVSNQKPVLHWLSLVVVYISFVVSS